MIEIVKYLSNLGIFDESIYDILSLPYRNAGLDQLENNNSTKLEYKYFQFFCVV